MAVSIALAAGLLSLGLGIASATRDVAPALALKAWPFDARARLHVGLISIGKQAISSRRGLKLARQAVRLDPTIPEAFAVLAEAKGLTREEKLRQLAYSRALSRRELGTTFLLMEDELRHGNLAAALANVDIALRTSNRADEIFTPLLVKATVDPEMVEELAKVLAKDPPWRAEFLTAAVQSSPAPRNMADLAMRLSKADRPISSPTVAILISRLIDVNEYALAWQLYGGAYNRETRALVRNGDFEEQGGGTPFDWILANDVDRWAARSGDKDGGTRLDFGVSAGAGGVVARQIVMLAPGRYRLDARAGEVEGAKSLQPTLSLYCVEGVELARLPILSSGSIQFAVPSSGCTAQVLSLVVQGDLGARESIGWIDSIAIERGAQ